ncbi:MAG: LysM peptidoglycan-binding domain-containing protein [Planctomycetia bacterium]
MAQRSKASPRRERDSDPLEALKPMLVLGLLGTILYGAYTIVQRGPGSGVPGWQPPGSPVAATASDAPPFQSPAVEMPTTAPSQAPVAVVPAPAAPAASLPPAGAVAEAAPDQPPTYLAAQSAAPPATAAPPFPVQPDPLPTALPAAPLSQAPSAGGPAAAAAFASDWADAHDKLAAGRYAEALALLSVWYDDTSLGIEESQRLEDLLSQLAGTVIYSQQDLLLPPHVVAAGETLQSIAATLGVPWQLLAKINGIDDPAKLIPGEQIKVLRGPFDAVVSVSRGRLSLQIGGNYAGSFPVVVGRQVQDRVGASLAVVDVRRGGPTAGPAGPTAQVSYLAASGGKSIVLGDGLSIEAVEDPSLIADRAPSTSLVVAAGDLDEIIDILGPGSHVLVRK